MTRRITPRVQRRVLWGAQTIFPHLPPSLRPAGATLEKFRRELVARYEETEKTKESILKPTFAGLHEMLADSMRSIADVVTKDGRCLVAMDRHASFALGRPCAIQDEE